VSIENMGKSTQLEMTEKCRALLYQQTLA